MDVALRNLAGELALGLAIAHAHAGAEGVFTVGFFRVAEFGFGEKLTTLERGVARLGHDVIFVIDHALKLAGDPQLSEVLAIGDSLATDMLGAARSGVDGVFVSGGIHQGEPIPEDFAGRHGLGQWRPIATVDSLA